MLVRLDKGSNRRQWSQLSKAVLWASSIGLVSCATTPTQVSATQSAKVDEPTIALVLGGGGAKGFAHIGVIKTLEANGIRPNLIVGSSVGSFVGSLYASGMSASQLEHLALTTSEDEFTDFTISHQGIVEGAKLREFVNTQVGNRSIEDLPIRFAAIATEKHSKKKTVFTQGETGLVVQASSSVPNIFIAPRIPDKVGKKYIDGGVSSMVPVDTAKDLGADVVIAVDILAQANDTQVTANGRNIWSMMDTAYTDNGKYSQSSSTPTQAEVNRADIVIRPNVANIASFDTMHRQEAIDAGVNATNAALTSVTAALSAVNVNIK